MSFALDECGTRAIVVAENAVVAGEDDALDVHAPSRPTKPTTTQLDTHNDGFK
jgi:hypothetical protein